MLDAARADRFGSYGYHAGITPKIDHLAERGVVFEQHYAQGTNTRESMPPLLFSRYLAPPLFPDDPQVPYAYPSELFARPDSEQISLPKALERAGFVTAAISAHLWTGKETLFAAEFSEMHDLTLNHEDARYPYPRAEAVIDRAVAWIDEHRNDDAFLYLHLMDTHFPHYFEADAQQLFGATSYSTPRFRDNGQVVVDPTTLSTEDLRYMDALYDGSLRYTDRQLGRLFDHLEKMGLLDHATVVITADHGDHLHDGADGRPQPGVPVFAHGGAWVEPLARVPWILVSPGALAPAHFESVTQSVDIAPTVLALAGLSLPQGKSFDGANVVDVLRGKTPPRDFALSKRGVRRGAQKLLWSAPYEHVLDPHSDINTLDARLFDLAADPFETTDRLVSDQGRAESLRSFAAEQLAGPHQRAVAARSHESPPYGFALSIRHFATSPEIPRLDPTAPTPVGWSLKIGQPHSILTAHATTEPLVVSVAIPNGTYHLSLGMAGQARLSINAVSHVLAPVDNMAAFAPIEVSDERLEARLEPIAGEETRILFFGFVPASADSVPAEAARERTERLKELGYIDD